MSEYTAEEEKERVIQSMGKEIGSLYDELWQQVAWLHIKWSEYVVIFGTKESRVVLMNSAAPAFTRMIQDCLWEDVILHIARITDRAQTAGRANLSLKRLVESIKEESLRPKLDELMEKIETASEFSRDWRNRHIAHRDLDLALKAGYPLRPASRKMVREALEAIAEVFNTISRHYMDEGTLFDLVGGNAGGAMSLLYIIDGGVKAEAEKRDRLRSGKYEPSDIEPIVL